MEKVRKGFEGGSVKVQRRFEGGSAKVQKRFGVSGIHGLVG